MLLVELATAASLCNASRSFVDPRAAGMLLLCILLLLPPIPGLAIVGAACGMDLIGAGGGCVPTLVWYWREGGCDIGVAEADRR